MTTQGQEFKLRVPKNLVKDYYVMKLASARPVKFDNISEAYMARKATQYEEETAANEPSFGAGSVYGKERKEEARKKRRGIIKKRVDPHDMPFRLRLGPNNSKAKSYTGKKEGGILDNSSYYVLTQCADGVFEAVPVHAWFNFTPDINYNTMTADEAEYEFSKRDKTINFWNLKIKKQLDDKDIDEESNTKASTSKVDSNEGGLKIHDDEHLSDGVDVEEFSDDSSSDDGKKKSKKKKKKESKRAAAASKKSKKNKGSDNDELPSDEEEELENVESKEMDYLSESSGEEIEIEDEPEPEKANEKAKDDLNADIMSESSEDEDENEEGEKLTDVGKELKQIMHRDEKEEESSNEEEEDEDIDDNDDKYSKSAVFMQGKDSKKKRSSGNNSGSGSNSRSATPTMNADNPKSSDSTSSTPDAGKKKSGSKRPLQTTPSPSSKKQKLSTTTTTQQDTSKHHHHHHHHHHKQSHTEDEDGAITEKAIRRYLVHKPMTTTDLVRKFKRKRTGLTKKETVDTIAAILKKIEPNRVHKDNVLYLSLKP